VYKKQYLTFTVIHMPLIRKLLYLILLGLIIYGLWLSPDFNQIAAGVAIFLFGMMSLEQGFQAFSGGTIERLLRKSTDRLWKSLSFGVVATSLMQSSSLVSVLTISFLTAGLIGLQSGIGIIFGANLGTTTGAWVIAGFGLKVELSAFALPMLVMGTVFTFQKNSTWKGIGLVLVGVGFLFLGIDYMKSGFEAFQDTIDLSAYSIPGLKGLLIYVLIGVVATVIMQSSHATLVLILTALAANQILYENALALAIGSNVGTTITAMIGSLNANAAGRRLAVAHLIFNLVTGLLAILLIGQFVYSVDWLSQELGIRDNDYTLKLALFHTLFNLLGVMVMLPLISPLVTFLERVVKEKKALVKEPKYLSDAALDSASAAIEVVRKETIRLYKVALKVLANGVAWRLHDIQSDKPLAHVDSYTDQIMVQNLDVVYQNQIKSLYAAIVDYISRARDKFSGSDADALREMRGAGYHIIEAVKAMKHLQKNLLVNIDSDNIYIRDFYNQFRLGIAEVIRTIYELSRAEEPTATTLTLDHSLMAINKIQTDFENTLEHLIRDRKITPAAATSLMTDMGYTIDICNSLASMARYLYAPEETSEREVERSLELEHDELQEIITEPPSEGGGGV
jgi:phosphate:Na+ symporter